DVVNTVVGYFADKVVVDDAKPVDDHPVAGRADLCREDLQPLRRQGSARAMKAALHVRFVGEYAVVGSIRLFVELPLDHNLSFAQSAEHSQVGNDPRGGGGTEIMRRKTIEALAYRRLQIFVVSEVARSHRRADVFLDAFHALIFEKLVRLAAQ